ncbi:MAG: pseudouridine synthase [Promethearchaeota archaeon]
MEKERLQKILSKHGYGSRRSCEKLIAENRVKINGLIAKLGDRGNLMKDLVEIDGNPIRKTAITKIYIALNKPRRILSEIIKRDDRKTVIDLVAIDEYLFIIGRLDFLSEGLILLTNDGELANKLTHPRYEHEKEYNVFVINKPNHKQLKAWRAGVVLDNGYKSLPAEVTIVKQNKHGAWLKIIMKEGKKRQIRETGSLLGLPVKRIIRMRIATVETDTLKSGEWRYLSDREIRILKDAAHLE